MSFSVSTRAADPGITVIELKGRITVDRERGEIQAAILKALNEGAQKIVVEMSGVTYIDSSGIGAIAYSFGKIAQKGARGAVAGAKGLVLDVFKMTRIDSFVNFYPDVAEASLALTAAGAKSA